MENRERKRKRQREWVAARRAEYIALRGGQCSQCGSTENMEFHHRDPSAKESHMIFSWKRTRIEEELAKCDLLCHICHRAIPVVWENRQVHHVHGTSTEYRRGCRCELCKLAKYEETKAYRKRQKERT